jgi:hypothetical protein
MNNDYKIKIKLPFKISNKPSRYGPHEHLTPSQVKQLFPLFSADSFDIQQVQKTVGEFGLGFTLFVANEFIKSHGITKWVGDRKVEVESLGGGNLYTQTRKRHIELFAKSYDEFNHDYYNIAY